MVSEVEKVSLTGPNYQKTDPFSNEFETPEKNSSLGISQVFNRDTLNGLPMDFVSQTTEYEIVKYSWWNTFTSWFKKSPAQSTSSTAATKETSSQMEPINSVPQLDAPDHIPDDLLNAQFPETPKKSTLKNTLTTKELNEAIASMSQKTIESIMFIVYKAQINLERDNAEVAEKTFSKYIDFQKTQQEVLQEIKDVLMKDEKVAKQLGKAQNFAVAAAIVSGIAAGAMSFGLLGPVGGFIGAALGQTAAGAFMAVAAAIGTYGPPVTAGLTGLTMGSKAYFKRRASEDKAKHEEVGHLDKYYNSRLDDMRDRLSTISKIDSVFKEHWIRFLKRLDKMRKLALKK